MMGKGKDMLKMMNQARKMQSKMKKQQKQLGKKVYEAETGAGMVRARVNGKLEVLKIETEAGALESLGIDSIMQLAAGAVNQALKKAQDDAQKDMMGMLDGMDDLKGMFGGM